MFYLSKNRSQYGFLYFLPNEMGGLLKLAAHLLQLLFCCKKKEIVQDVTLHDLDMSNARPQGGHDFLSLMS